MSESTPTNNYILESAEEAERLNTQHLVYKEAQNGRLVLAPIDFSAADLRILDSATSDGTWLFDLRQDISSSGRSHSFIGIDISQERFPSSPPKDVTFHVQDVTATWPESWIETFDLVHQRLTLAGTGSKTEAVVQTLLKLVKPGGWVQLIEAEQIVADDDGPAMHQMNGLILDVFEGLGTDIGFPRKMKGWIEEAGFINTGTTLCPSCIGAKVPNPALRKRSVESAVIAMTGLVGFAKTIPNGLKCMSAEELDTFIPRFKAEMEKQGGYYPMRIVWGQRPL